MASVAPSNLEVIHAYRSIYRSLLRAIQYARPARFAARDALREAFRQPSNTSTSPSPSPLPHSSLSESGSTTPGLDKECVKRTVWFLQAAERERGLEHKILKNLLKVRVTEYRTTEQKWKTVYRKSQMKNSHSEERDSARRHYDMTIAMLNQTLGLALR